MNPDELKSQKPLEDNQNSNADSLNDETVSTDNEVQAPLSVAEPQVPDLTSTGSTDDQTDLSQSDSTENTSETSDVQETEASDTLLDDSLPSSSSEYSPSNVDTSTDISGSDETEISQASIISSDTQKPKTNKKFKLLLVLVIVIIVLLGGAAYAYFGYYMSPSTIWNDSLANTSSGYNKLVSYINTQSAVHYSGVNVNGSFNLQMGSNHSNGSLNFESYNKNSTASIKLDLGAGNLDLEERSIAVSSSLEPDIYFQVNGINQLASSLPSYAPLLDKIDGQWIVVDHNLLADLISQGSNNKTSSLAPSWSSISSFLLTTSSINQKYLFSSNKSYAVLNILKSYGQETINGVNTEHYLVGFNKANTKSYLNALCSAFVGSSLGNYFKQQSNSLFQMNASSCSNFSGSANSLNSSDTFQLWDNIDKRMPYMVRFSDKNNPLQNYIDLGLNYNGGTSYPFFISGTSKSNGATTNLSSNITLNTSNNSVVSTVNVTYNSSSKDIFNGNFSFVPTNNKINIQTPEGTIPITTVLSNLGISSQLSGLPISGANPTAL